MLKNYLKTSWRNLTKNKAYSAINIVGLATGLGTCLLIMLYLSDELSYDRYNKKAGRIYRINNDVRFGDNHFDLCQAPPLMGPAMKDEFPEVEQYMRFLGHGSILVKKENENLRENKVVYADSTLFEVFTLPMIAGDPATALKDPHSLVITEHIARKYFNRTDVIGEKMLFDNNRHYKITGVIRNIPQQSHFNFDFFLAMSEVDDSRSEESWLSQNYNTYITVKRATDIPKLESAMTNLLERKSGPLLQTTMNITLDEFKQQGSFLKADLTSLTDIHLQSNKLGELSSNGNSTYVYIFGVITLFILLIACVNFMNLSTARSSTRAREVGVRKVLGSLRKNLVTQFLLESLVISFVSSLLAFMAAWLLLPWFNDLSGKNLSANLLLQPEILFTAILLMLVVGLLAGCYPAFFLAAFQPIQVLKGVYSKGLKGLWLRNVLVVFQFTVSIVLIAGTLIIYQQLTFIRNHDIGFDRNQVLTIQNTGVLGDRVTAFKNSLSNITGVQQVTVSGFLPIGGARSSHTFFTTPTLDQKSSLFMQKWKIDEQYINTLGLQVIRGRNFSTDLPTDSSGIIINEAAARFLHGEEVLNKPLYWMKGNTPQSVITFRVIGVVRDFNFSSLHDMVEPMALVLGKETSSLSMRIKTSDLRGLLAQIKNIWITIAPGEPFAYSFMDEQFSNQYKTEQQTGKLFITFAILAILIACLGLFGLFTYTATQRTKEIGIRKVLGASAHTIMGMLSKDFLKLVLIASGIGFPLFWWAMNKWLQDFAYRVHISWWVFAAAGSIALVIALGTISFQAIKVAFASPVKTLRTE